MWANPCVTPLTSKPQLNPCHHFCQLCSVHEVQVGSIQKWNLQQDSERLQARRKVKFFTQRKDNVLYTQGWTLKFLPAALVMAESYVRRPTEPDIRRPCKVANILYKRAMFSSMMPFTGFSSVWTRIKAKANSLITDLVLSTNRWWVFHQGVLMWWIISKPAPESWKLSFSQKKHLEV